MQCSRLLYPFAWLPRRAKHHGQKVTRLSDFENGQHMPLALLILVVVKIVLRTKRFVVISFVIVVSSVELLLWRKCSRATDAI